MDKKAMYINWTYGAQCFSENAAFHKILAFHTNTYV
jgi:hypothetical protein